jgi:AcrR family transcriptional regulator
MGNNATARRQDLRQRLLDAAEARIASDGLARLTARDVTADAGCAVGSLYTAYDTLDLLVMHVNARTLARLDASLRAAAAEQATPAGRLSALARAYVGFALEHRQLWAALFDHRPSESVDTPAWLHEALARLIGQIAEPLALLRPDLDEIALRQRARTLFAAVHGVVHLSLTGRFVGTPRAALADEVQALVDALTRGIDANRTE